MINFLFGSLFSWIFWILYFGIGLFVGTISIRIMAPKTYHFIFKGEEEFSENVGCLISLEWIAVLFFNYFLWPITFPLIVIFFIFKYFSLSLLNVIRKIDNIIPDIEIKRKEEK